MSDNEDLYGHAANEAAQGYEPMPDRQAEAITQAEEAAQPYKAKEFLDDQTST
jgi:hypothetical protein